MKKYKGIIISFILGMIVMGVFCGIVFHLYKKKNEPYMMTEEQKEIFDNLEILKGYIDQDFVDSYDVKATDEDLINGIYKGYVAALGDPFTKYKTAEENSESLSKDNSDYFTYEMLDNNVGYIKFTEFLATADQNLYESLSDLTSQGMESLIVDMRGNKGGGTQTAVNMVSAFIPNGELVIYTVNKAGERTDYMSEDSYIKATDTYEDLNYDMPIVILTDGDSISSAEIFTGALKYFDRATVIGTTTYGKGIGQLTYGFGDGQSVSVTAFKYYFADDSSIHQIGVEPDIEVEDDPETADVDEALQAATDYLLDN